MENLFSYPFNASNLMRSKSKIKEELSQIAEREVRIFVLSGSTTAELTNFIELFLLHFGIKSKIKVGNYNTYFEDALFTTKIKEFEADWVYLHTTYRNLTELPPVAASADEINARVESSNARLNAILDAVLNQAKYLIINAYDKPAYRNLGNLSAYHPAGNVSFIRRLNDHIGKIAQSSDRVFLNDLDYLCSVVGLDVWHNQDYWSAFKYAVSPQAMPTLAASLASIIAAAEGRAKKALVCDLDNTLWGGVIGDDGVEGIKIGPESAKGEAHSELQAFAKTMKERGIALAVNSKNEDSLARQGFEHQHSLLSTSDFASFIANWDPKSSNLDKIAKAVNIGMDSLVFIDDNPAEIEQVRNSKPEITAIGFSKNPVELAIAIDRLGLFETVSLSQDDINRTSYYEANAAREDLRAKTGSIEDYLKSLGMSAKIEAINEGTRERAVQLINKTNQFNPTTRRIDAQEMQERLHSDATIGLSANLKDKFGDNGIVSILLAHQAGEDAEIDIWVMSCRVFNRTLEVAMFDIFVRECMAREVKSIKASFHPTQKNKYVEGLYDKLGFELVREDETGKRYQLSLNTEWENRNTIIEVNGV